MRHLMGFTLVTAAIVCPGAGAGDKSEAIQKERKSLEGRWTIVLWVQEGYTVFKSLKGCEMTFAGDKFTWKFAGEKEGSFDTLEGTYQVDPSKSPKWIDITITKPEKQMTRAIYQLDGDKLQLCMDVTDFERKVTSPRPAKFDEKYRLIRLEREKK